HALELSPVHGPPQAGQDHEDQHHRQRNQQIQDVHQTASSFGLEMSAGRGRSCPTAPPWAGASAGRSRASRAALTTTSSELSAMPSPASQAGIHPTTASGTHNAL